MLYTDIKLETADSDGYKLAYTTGVMTNTGVRVVVNFRGYVLFRKDAPASPNSPQNGWDIIAMDDDFWGIQEVMKQHAFERDNLLMMSKSYLNLHA